MNSNSVRRVYGCLSGLLRRLLGGSVHPVEGIEVLLVGIGEGVKVFLGGGDLGVAHAVHDGFEVGASGEQPGCVSVAQVVDADGEVDPRRGNGRSPYPGTEGVPGEGGALAGGEQQVTGSETAVGDVSAELCDQFGWQAYGAGIVVHGVGLGQHPLAGGGVLDRDLDDGIVNGDLPGVDVEVEGFEDFALDPA